MLKIPSKKQCASWLKSRYDYKSTNVSGCPFWPDTGFPDCHLEGVGFVEIKRGNEKFKPGQIEWINRVHGFVFRFWEDHVDVYDKDLVHVQVIKYDEDN